MSARSITESETNSLDLILKDRLAQGACYEAKYPKKPLHHSSQYAPVEVTLPHGATISTEERCHDSRDCPFKYIKNEIPYCFGQALRQVESETLEIFRSSASEALNKSNSRFILM